MPDTPPDHDRIVALEVENRFLWKELERHEASQRFVVTTLVPIIAIVVSTVVALVVAFVHP